MQIGTKDDTGVGTSNAVMHLNEATPHLHIDYIPIGHFDRGLETRNAMAKALEEMGYGMGANSINRWRLAEWEVLKNICTAHGIEISEPKKFRGYSCIVEEYGEHQDEIRRLNEEKEQALSERDEIRSDLDRVSKKKVKLTEIDNVKTDKTVFGGKVTVSLEDWQNVTDLAKKEVASQKQTKKLRQERDELKEKLSEVTSELEEYKKRDEDA